MSDQKIDKMVIIRLIVVALAAVNSILIGRGMAVLPFGENDVYQFGSDLFLVATVAWAYWKNNSFTSAAKKADIVLANNKAEIVLANNKAGVEGESNGTQSFNTKDNRSIEEIELLSLRIAGILQCMEYQKLINDIPVNSKKNSED